jgi:hypothetical protein
MNDRKLPSIFFVHLLVLVLLSLWKIQPSPPKKNLQVITKTLKSQALTTQALPVAQQCPLSQDRPRQDNPSLPTPPAKKTEKKESSPKPAPAAIKKPEPAPEKAQKKTDPAAKTPPPSPSSAPVKEPPKQAPSQAALAKLMQSTLSALDSPAKGQTNSSSTLLSIGPLACEKPDYNSLLMGILTKSIILPESSDVYLQITIESNGVIKDCKILESRSEANTRYVLESLPRLKLPPPDSTAKALQGSNYKIRLLAQKID